MNQARHAQSVQDSVGKTSVSRTIIPIVSVLGTPYANAHPNHPSFDITTRHLALPIWEFLILQSLHA